MSNYNVTRSTAGHFTDRFNDTLRVHKIKKIDADREIPHAAWEVYQVGLNEQQENYNDKSRQGRRSEALGARRRVDFNC